MRIEKSATVLVITILFIVLVAPQRFESALGSSGTSFRLGLPANDSALTFDTAQNLENPEGQPDLVGVVATNGEFGYVYYDDLYDASAGDLPSMSPEEAVRTQTERNARLAPAFKDAAAELYGAELLTEQDALDGLEMFQSQEGMDGAVKLLNARMADASGGRGSFQPMSEHEFQILYDSAVSAVGSSIPVYRSDGVTKIGEFSVGVK